MPQGQHAKQFDKDKSKDARSMRSQIPTNMDIHDQIEDSRNQVNVQKIETGLINMTPSATDNSPTELLNNTKTR